MSETARLRLPLIAAAQAQKHVTHNEALRLLDALVQLSVLDRNRSAPPDAPAEGDCHIVAAGATGAWAWRDNAVAARLGGVWEFLAPRPGWCAWVVAENTVLVFDGAAWGPLTLATITALQNLTRLGISTTADATTPFAAKLNKALWTARTAEGGDGDLRCTLNKEGSARTLALLFQSAFSGRAEIGLVGDKDLAIRVSGNGSAWTDALKFDRTTGAATFAATPKAGANSLVLSDDGRLSNERTPPDNSVGNVKLADMAAGTIKGRATAGTGDPEDLTVPQVKAMVAQLRAVGVIQDASTTPAFTSQTNLASVSRVSAGVYDFTFTTAEPDNGYIIVTTSANFARMFGASNFATTGFRMTAYNDADVATDTNFFRIAVMRY